MNRKKNFLTFSKNPFSFICYFSAFFSVAKNFYCIKKFLRFWKKDKWLVKRILKIENCKKSTKRQAQRNNVNCIIPAVLHFEKTAYDKKRNQKNIIARFAFCKINWIAYSWACFYYIKHKKENPVFWIKDSSKNKI